MIREKLLWCDLFFQQLLCISADVIYNMTCFLTILQPAGLS